MDRFEVSRIKIAKEMMKLGSQCIGCYLDKNGYVIYQFERSQQTLNNYRQVKQQF